MKLVFHTNLDEAKSDVFELNGLVNDRYGHRRDGIEIPREGDRIVFPFNRWDHRSKRERDFTYELNVCKVRWNYAKAQIEVELHLTPHDGSIAQWTEWFGRHRHGRGLECEPPSNGGHEVKP